MCDCICEINHLEEAIFNYAFKCTLFTVFSFFVQEATEICNLAYAQFQWLPVQT